MRTRAIGALMTIWIVLLAFAPGISTTRSAGFTSRQRMRAPSSRPAAESHDLAIFADPAFQHTAFKVASLADLRAFYQRVIGRGVPVRMAFNHGVSLAFYFDDPEGRLVEVYWPTGVACRQPHGDPLDLTLSEEALRRDVAELAGRPGAAHCVIHSSSISISPAIPIWRLAWRECFQSTSR